MTYELAEAARVEIFRQRLAEIADGMGTVLRRAAVSPNIRERADFSCAIFDPEGRVVSEAQHVPVHLGSMGAAVRAVRAAVPLEPGVVAIVNDPFAGGTHLPDLTLVAAVHALGEGCIALVACRAHHADVGGTSPGSMPVGTRARRGFVPMRADVPPAVGPRYASAENDSVDHHEVTIADEGLRIPPVVLDDAVLARLEAASRSPAERKADLAAQRAALRYGQDALVALAHAERGALARGFDLLYAYGERLMRATLRQLPEGIYPFADSLDDDGAGNADVALRVVLHVENGGAIVDLEECDDETPGSLNAVRAVTEAAVAYAFRTLLPADAPTSEGVRAPIQIRTRPGSILDARPPRAVAAGNVETSQRIVDLVLGALAQAVPTKIPAASAGSMSNLLLGTVEGAYYETIGGGAGGGPTRAGASGVQTHMTNTRNTPIEELEASWPLRVVRYGLRRGSGGGGVHRGGDGLIRELELLAPLTVTLIGDRRRRPPYGLSGGGPGHPGEDRLTRDGRVTRLPAKIVLDGEVGDRICIETPGGGGHGDARKGKFWAALLSGSPITREDLGQ
jgi:N-methylhydantoinase B